MFEKGTNVPTVTRRQFFQIGAVGVSGFYLQPFLRPLQVHAKEKVGVRGSAEYCIFLNLAGGASHVDTFDIKEERWTPPDFDIRTIKPGVRMPYALFPELSEKLEQLTLVRSMKAWETEHIRAQYYLQVAHAPSPARMKEMPSLGSVIAYEFDQRRRESDYLPPFVAINFTSGPFKAVGEGVLESRNSPLLLEISERGFDFLVPEKKADRFRRRWEFLQKFDKPLRYGVPPGDKFFQDFDAFYQGAHAMMKSPAIRDVMTLEKKDQEQYGSSQIGDACALARNLVRAEAGTRFIMISQPGWDMHGSIYKKPGGLYKRTNELDTAFSALLADLQDAKGPDGRSLLEKTLIVCMGEFGRTPGELTVNTGRDHYPNAFTSVFAGGGTQGGRVLGATDDLGAKIKDSGWHKQRPVYFEDVAATIYSSLGIDWTKKITNTPSGRDFEYVEHQSGTEFINPGEITELFS